jgi:hypothetical protein
MIIPGFLITWVTFPGVIVHEFAHALFCKLFGVEIYEVKYFQIKVGLRQPAGYVRYRPPAQAWKEALIGIGPFFVNTIVGGLIAAPAAIPVFTFNSHDPFDYFLIWLGISIAMHAFPSIGDASTIWRAVKGPTSSVLTKVVAMPLVGLIYLGALGSIFLLDAVYGMVIAGALPELLVKLLA